MKNILIIFKLFKKCKKCGCDFEPSHPFQKYCSYCRGE